MLPFFKISNIVIISTELRRVLSLFVLCIAEPETLGEKRSNKATTNTVQDPALPLSLPRTQSPCRVFIFKAILLGPKSCLYPFAHRLLYGSTPSLAEANFPV